MSEILIRVEKRAIEITQDGYPPQFLVSQTGPRGVKGNTGFKGDKGDKGDIGLKGDKGDKGDGFTGGVYNSSTGVVTFTSADGIGFATADLRGADSTVPGPKGDGWTGVTYNPSDGKITFASSDGLGYTTADVRGADGLGWTGGSYDAGTGIVTFASTDGIGFATADLRGADSTVPGPKGDGFTGGAYNASTGVVTFTSADGLGFATGDLRGADGQGTGDMIIATYDPQGVSADAFARDNHTGTQSLATISDAGSAAALDVPASGDAAASEVVKGDDSRLSDARTPTSHTHTAAQITDFDTEVASNSAVAANTAKVTNATHTGEVTGSQALTIANKAVTNAKMADMVASTLKGRDAGTGAPQDLTAAEARSILNVADGATVNATDAALRARSSHTGTQSLATISDAGSAAALDAPASGDAAASEVVKGNDSRLSDARTPTAHSHTVSDISDFPTLGTAAAADTGDFATAAQGIKADNALPKAGGVMTGDLVVKGVTETVYSVSGTTPALSPANGTIQTWTLSGASTPTAGTWNAGESITLMIDDGAARTITWSSLAVTWKTGGGTAPTLLTTGYTAIQLWKVGSTIYGALVGDA